MTPAERRSAAWLVTGLAAPTVTPGSDSPTLRQQAGWGYSGLAVTQAAPPVSGDAEGFVYRKRRLRARKRRFN
jgi:hypothetical protein